MLFRLINTAGGNKTKHGVQTMSELVETCIMSILSLRE